jgi:hypothetical protein
MHSHIHAPMAMALSDAAAVSAIDRIVNLRLRLARAMAFHIVHPRRSAENALAFVDGPVPPVRVRESDEVTW